LNNGHQRLISLQKKIATKAQKHNDSQRANTRLQDFVQLRILVTLWHFPSIILLYEIYN